MIIGISGKSQSGKDEVGKIIQYLTCKTTGLSFEQFKNNEWLNITASWQVIKFADSIKKIVCLLTGCTRKQLEDQDFKNSRLPKEWNYSYGENQIGGIRKIVGDVHQYTYREFLLKLGDLLREEVHPNVFVNPLMNLIDECKDENIVVSDVRLSIEFKEIKKRNGILIRVNKDLISKIDSYTETALDNYPFDYVIENNSSIEDLIEKVREILIKEKIIE